MPPVVVVRQVLVSWFPEFSETPVPAKPQVLLAQQKSQGAVVVVGSVHQAVVPAGRVDPAEPDHFAQFLVLLVEWIG
jgi:hypothetical protein